VDRDADVAVVYTVGHSTRSLPELAQLLESAGVRELLDIRSVPRSRRHPHFEREALARSLPERGIDYTLERALGGFRRPHPGSPNRGWDHEAFQGYADYMTGEEFRSALERLQARARERVLCVMCAEAQWWRCHRRLLADALIVRGWKVLHLGLGGAPLAHELTPFAVVGDDRALTYPPPQTELGLGV
jgi:uncharacterized protein (DUF488 family)